MIVFCRNLIYVLKHRRLMGVLFGLLLSATAVYVSGPYLRAGYHYQAGQKALERRAFIEAQKHAAVCLEVWPRGARSHLLAARAARRAGLLDEAQQHLDACPPSPDILEERQLERMLLQVQRGGLAEVDQLLRQQVELDHPQSPAILEVLSWEWMRTFQLGEALWATEVWLQRQPREIEALVRHGWICEHLSHKIDALEDYRQALALDPHRDPVRQRLAEILLSLHQDGEAAEQFEYLRRKRPEDSAALLGLVRCRIQQSRLDEAEELLDDLLAHHKEVRAALGERGRLALARGQLEQAEAWLRRAVAALPHDKDIVYNLICCLQRQGKDGEAEAYVARLRQIEEDARRMEKLVQQVLQTPKSAPLRYEIGILFLRNGFEEDGRNWLRTALEQDPTYQPARQALAQYQPTASTREHLGER
jgi:tetratricopeptide (TPR) repeat protein